MTWATYAMLVATHQGEFWPFSIYPMFSEAAKPWVRTVAYELPPARMPELRWQEQALDDVPGIPFAAQEHGIEVVDLAKYVSMTERWDAERIAGLRKMLGEHRDEHLVLYAVSGRLEGEGDTRHVELSYRPVVALGDGVDYTGPAAQP